MSASDYSAFGNDDAMDWLAELEEAEDTSIIEEAFETILGAAEDYIEIPEASITIAAAEVVAALLGKASKSLPEEVIAWVKARNGVESLIVEKARAAVNRVLADSELQEVWEDEGESGWEVSVQELLGRLGAAS